MLLLMKMTIFIFIDKNFNSTEHFIELAHGTRSNNVAMKRRTVAIFLHTSNSNSVHATFENTLSYLIIISVFFLRKQPHKMVQKVTLMVVMANLSR